MKLRTCRSEAEIKRQLELGHWPQSSPVELRAHVATCRSCGDLVLLTEAFRGARAVSAAAAQPPPASVLWWRAQLRRRDAAVKRVQRPLLGAQAFAFAVAFAMLMATFAYQASHGTAWITAWLSAMADWLPHLQHWSSDMTQSGFLYLVPGAAMLLLLGGVVVYLATEKQ